MDFYVYSRNAISAAQPHDESHVIISITSGPTDVARFRIGKGCRGILRLSFPDLEIASPEIAEEQLFSADHAREIWTFVSEHQPSIERIIVHCDAGKSRSPAVAAALAKRLNGDDAEFFGGRYTPNMRVYRLLLGAL